MKENQPIIEVKNIGKKYDINHARGSYVSLRDVVANVFKAPFSFLKSKAKQVAGLEKKEEFWALRNINFSVNRGEVVGVIGANGAGKSTLLKVLSQITPPTEGEVILRGRVGSLLEVGTGFHPELSGRENIFLNGAILGMKKAEIEKKFDQIVQFAGIEKFLDTRVKHYSSGMYVRLAFSVAAHMEPDILLVDEVLAVGDAEFQKKCLGKMDEITKTEGRTILFVSHNMEAIQRICARCIAIEKGKIMDIGETSEVIRKYLDSVQSSSVKTFNRKIQAREAQIHSIAIKNKDGKNSTGFSVTESFQVEVQYELKQELPAFVIIKLFKTSIPRHYILVSLSNDNNQISPKEPGLYKATVHISPLLNSGIYSLVVGISTDTAHYLDRIEEYNILSIRHDGDYAFPTSQDGRKDALVVAPMKWKVEKI